VDESDDGAYAFHMPSREAILGFLFGLAVLVAAYAFDLPGVIGGALLVLIFGGWIFFSIRDRRKRST
jgi:hypothetical protein